MRGGDLSFSSEPVYIHLSFAVDAVPQPHMHMAANKSTTKFLLMVSIPAVAA